MPAGSTSEGERHETAAERIDRNLTELLQELRIAAVGVQVLFGFLLSLPFTNKFSALDHAQRNLWVTDLLISAIATALLMAPVAHHRIVFRRHEKARILRHTRTQWHCLASVRWASRPRGHCCSSSASSTAACSSPHSNHRGRDPVRALVCAAHDRQPPRNLPVIG